MRGQEEPAVPDFDTLIRAAIAETDVAAATKKLVAGVTGHEDAFIQVLRSGTWKEELKAGWYKWPNAKPGAVAEGEPLDDEINHVLYLTGGGNKARPLAILCPFTSGRSRDLMGEAKRFAVHGFDALIVPAREVGTGWTAKHEEHVDVLAALRRALLIGPVDPDRVLVTGYSRGGHAAWDVGLRNADRFALIAPRGGTMVHTGGYTRTGGVYLENAHDMAVQVSWGMKDAEAIAEGNTEGSRVLKKLGYVIDSRPHEGGHVPVLKIDEIVAFAAGKTRPHVPKKLIKVANLPWDGRHHWIEIVERRGKPWDPTMDVHIEGKLPKNGIGQRRVIWKAVAKDHCRVEAKLDGNKVRIEANKPVKKLRLHWRADMFDMEKFVYIFVNGRKKASQKLKRDMNHLVGEFLRTGDHVRLWDGQVTFSS